MYSAGDLIDESISTAVHSGMVTPVVSWPTDSVIVYSCDCIAAFTRLNALSLAAWSSPSMRPSPAASTIS